MAYTSAAGKVHYVRGNATTAEVNAGKVIVSPRPGKSICITGGHMVARGGNAATATSVDIKDTAGTPVVGVACAVAGLTANARLDFRAASNVTLTTFQQALTADKGLKIQKTGSNLATATSVDYYVEFIYV